MNPEDLSGLIDADQGQEAPVIRLSAAVMAHPKRTEMVESLLAELDRPVPVVWDQCNDRHETGLRALLAADPDATHHLVIQDDAVPCGDLLAGMEAALAHVPAGHPACFYVGRVRPFRQLIDAAVRLAGDEASWLRMPGPYWGPAIVVPTADVPALATWWHGAGRRIPNYDRRIARFYAARGLNCYYSWPSLVDHRGDVSLIGHGTSQRRAHRALKAGQSALEVGWSGPVVEVRGAERADARRDRDAARASRARLVRG